MQFNKIFNLIMQQLTQAQKQLTDSYTVKRSKDLNFGPFKEQRTYFPLPKHAATDLAIPQNIALELDKVGFYITDYRNGIAIKKTIDGQKPDLRQVKIGKILSRINKPELKKQFDERLAGNIKSVDKDLSICITHNPYDIAGMSTGRNWTSCMELDKGAFRQTPLLEVQYGGMCAYLIDSDDKNIQHPYARIAIKRLIDKFSLKYFIFVAQRIIYGDVQFAKQMHFYQNVNKILDKSNTYTSGDAVQFERDDAEWKAYSDSGFSKIYYLKDINQLDKKLQSGYNFDIQMVRELCKQGNVPAQFVIKYIDNFKNQLLLLLQNHTYTADQLDQMLPLFYQKNYKKMQPNFQKFKKMANNVMKK